jgi:class 3 adenylate cyclase
MRALVDLASKPVSFSFLLAVAVGTALYQTGRQTVPYADKAARSDLNVLAYKVSNAFLVYEWQKRSEDSAQALKATLRDAIIDQRVAGATVRDRRGEVVGTARESQAPLFRAGEFVLPIMDSNDKNLGTISFDLVGKPAADSSLKREVALFPFAAAALAFFTSFAFSFAFLRRRDGFLPSLIAALKKLSAGNLDVSLSVPRDEELADLARSFNSMVDALQERDRMRYSLGRVMDPKIAEILIKENPKVGGLRRKATIMFCDIRNYTTLCEQMTAEELQEFLNEYWKDTVEIIMEQEGTIDKFHGDGVCVVWGAPILHEDDSLRAVRTAWRLVQNVERLNKRREDQRKMPIQIGVGIHMGEVIAGHIGSERRMDYTVVGDVVNVAARIEELNKKFGTKILISDKVYEEVESHVRVKTLTLAYLRGHKKPILVHALREFSEPAVEEAPVPKLPDLHQDAA